MFQAVGHPWVSLLENPSLTLALQVLESTVKLNKLLIICLSLIRRKDV